MLLFSSLLWQNFALKAHNLPVHKINTGVGSPNGIETVEAASLSNVEQEGSRLGARVQIQIQKWSQCISGELPCKR